MLAAAALPEQVSALAVVDAYPHPAQTPGSARIARWVATSANQLRRFDPAIARQFRELLEAGVATRADLMPMWEAGTCPAVVVRGAESEVLPAEIAAEMIAALPHARLETVVGVGHGIPYAKPRELARILLQLSETAG